MAKRRTKKTTKGSSSAHENNVNNTQTEELPLEKQQHAFNDHEVECRITAIRAIRDAESEHLLTRLRLLRSYFNKEQLETPALQFFKENLPNLSLLKNEEDGEFELEWKFPDGKLPVNHTDEGHTCGSRLHQTSAANPDFVTAMAATGGLEFSSQAVIANFLGAASLHIPDFVLEEPSETQLLGLQDTIQTPVVNSERLSVGMTPKTLRLPKHGEMLLSVRGSPLGVYRKDNMEAIHETEEG